MRCVPAERNETTASIAAALEAVLRVWLV